MGGLARARDELAFARRVFARLCLSYSRYLLYSTGYIDHERALYTRSRDTVAGKSTTVTLIVVVVVVMSSCLREGRT